MPNLTRRTVLQTGAATALAGWLGVAGPGGRSGLAYAAPAAGLSDEDGYDLWMRYRPIEDPGARQRYWRFAGSVHPEGSGAVLDSAAAELERGIEGMLGTSPPPGRIGEVRLGTYEESAAVRGAFSHAELDDLGTEGYGIRAPRGATGLVVGSTSQRGVLYGTFHLLRLMQRGQPVNGIDILERPANPLRMVNHWDDLDRNVERGYAGLSIFHWDELPETRERYVDYARSLASVGLNGTVVNSVNASPQFLSTEMLTGLAALADVLRAWGLRMFLSANYASPMTLTADDPDPITTADPFEPRVQAWWQDKVAEIYEQVPDFGGFLVKANSEGQPGPLDYGRTHAEGANMLAEAIEPHGGIIIWRSFVHGGFSDWAEYQYEIFAPLDGDFHDNVVVQTKNGPVDFQVREPVHPLFGAMPRTNQGIELQLTQEYTGHEVHLCYLVPQWKEVLDFDTRAHGKGSTVASIVSGQAYDQTNTGLIGVINYGDDQDWTGYQLGAANTHGFARLAWDPGLSAEEIVTEWIEMTFGADPELVEPLAQVLLGSWSAYEDYTSPLGMGYLTFPTGSHFDPDPIALHNQSHHTTTEGTGFDRTVATGTGYTGMYADHWAAIYESLDTVPDELLLFMHWVPFTHQLNSGSTVIQHIYDSHFEGLEEVEEFRQVWADLAGQVDEARHADIMATFDDHLFHAQRWRDVIVDYFFGFARVLDEDRNWLSYASAPSTPLLLGGWPNLLDVRISNGTSTTQQITAEVDDPGEGWTVSSASIELESTASGIVRLPVRPPLVAEQEQRRVRLSSDVMVLGDAGQPTVVVPAGQRCHVALDAGTDSSPAVPGYDRLSPSTMWDADRGFGWVEAGPQGRDRAGRWDAIRRDFCGDTRPRTLRLRLPAGRHECAIFLGDGGPDVWPTYVDVDGERVAEGNRIRGGTFEWITFEVDGGTAGREVDLEFSSIGTRFWRLCALVIPDPDRAIPPVTILDAPQESALLAGVVNEVSIELASTGATSTDVTLTGEAPDGWEIEPAQVQVPGDGHVTAVLRVTPPDTPQVATLTVGFDVDDFTETRPIGVITTPAPQHAALVLDAGPATSPVLEGYERLAPEDAWDGDRGYGWTGETPDVRDRDRMDVLRRDFVLGRQGDYTLRVAVPAGRHEMHVLTGDAYSPSGITTIYEGDTELGRSGDSEIPQADFIWFSFDLDGGASGRTATLRFEGSLRDEYWRIVALALMPH